MESARVRRIIEGSLVFLFFWQAYRWLAARITQDIVQIVLVGQAEVIDLVGTVLFVIVPLIVWFLPGTRKALPDYLSGLSVVAAVGRVVMALALPIAQQIGAYVVVAAAVAYAATLLRANWRSWVVILLTSSLLDQMFRAGDTFDISLRSIHYITINGTRYAAAWLFLQIPLSLFLVIWSRHTRSSVRDEPFEPANLSLLGGLGLAGFIALEASLLAVPAAMARWALVPVTGLIPWVLLATALPLIPVVRISVSGTQGLFDDRLLGWVWFFLIIATLLIGARVGGVLGAVSLMLAQFGAVWLVWSLPVPPNDTRLDTVGPAVGMGFVLANVLTILYGVMVASPLILPALSAAGLLVLILAVALLNIPQLFSGQSAVWQSRMVAPMGVPVMIVAGVFVLSMLIATSPDIAVASSRPDSLRVATYNINHGRDANGDSQIELISLTAQAAQADIIVLQEVAGAQPVTSQVDQVHFLARQLGMNYAYHYDSEYLNGVAVLSYWPISDVQGTDLPGGNQSYALQVTLIEPLRGRPLSVMAVQIEAANVEIRLRQLAVLLDMQSGAAQRVLAGSLSASPTDVVIQQISQVGYADPDQQLGIERGFTTPADIPALRHDYVFGAGLAPLDSRQVDSVASDHRLVVVEFGW